MCIIPWDVAATIQQFSVHSFELLRKYSLHSMPLHQLGSIDDVFKHLIQGVAYP